MLYQHNTVSRQYVWGDAKFKLLLLDDKSVTYIHKTQEDSNPNKLQLFMANHEEPGTIALLTSGISAATRDG